MDGLHARGVPAEHSDPVDLEHAEAGDEVMQPFSIRDRAGAKPPLWDDTAQISRPVDVEAAEVRTGASGPLNGDTAEALVFLRKWPTDFPHLVSISTNGSIEACAFDREDLRDGGPVERWIDRRQGRANLYFSVNTLGEPIDKKASKTDVAEIVALHGDVDPPAGADQEAFADEAIGVLLKLDRPPSVIIKSGGGVQPFWILKDVDRILVQGDKSKIEDAECYTRGIEELLTSRGLKADACHNVDRVMRLPGTINLPNKIKIAKGRKPALATVAYYSEAVYSLSDFPRAAAKGSISHQKAKGSTRSHYPCVDPDNPELEGLDDKWKDPELADKYYESDRSSAALALAIACKAAGVSDETIENILMTWEVGGHIHDQPDPQRALARVLHKANEQVPDAKDELPPVGEDELSEQAEAEDDSWLDPKPIDPNFDFAKIPPRDWIVPELLVRSFATCLISPGGVGKTQWGSSLAVAISADRQDICGFQVKQPGRVWYWNQEDDENELNRRFGATMQKFGVDPLPLREKGKLFWNSGVKRPLLIAKRKKDRSSVIIEAAEVEKIIARIKRIGIDVFIIDPLVEFHEGEENDNVQMRQVMAVARRIAVDGNCAVLVVAHTKKPPQASSESYAGDIDALRGASAQANVMRIVYTFFNMSKKDAKNWGVSEDEAHLYARMDDAKANLFLSKDQPRWFKRVSVKLGGPAGETIGVLEPVALSKSQNTDVLETIAKTIAAGNRLSLGKPYSLSVLFGHMTESEKAAFGSGSNRSRVIKAELDGPGWVSQSADVHIGLTAYGKLTVQKKKGRDGLQFCLEAEATAVPSGQGDEA